MIGVFIIMLNVLIAAVCDSYSVALSEAHEIFLRSRMHIVANLDMQGLTRRRNVPSLNTDSSAVMMRMGDEKGGSNNTDYGSGGAYYGNDKASSNSSERKSFFHSVPMQKWSFQQGTKQSSSWSSIQFDKKKEEDEENCISRAVSLCFGRVADWLDRSLKDSKWHFYMRKFLVIGRDLNFKESLGKSSQLEIDNENETMDMMKKIESKVKVLEEQQLLSENRIMRRLEDLTRAIEQQSAIISRPPPPPPPQDIPMPPPPPPATEPSPELLAALIKATQDTVRETMKELNKSNKGLQHQPVFMRPPSSPPPLMPSPRRGFNPRRSSSAKPSWAKGDNDP
jgi:hypothetical protein